MNPSLFHLDWLRLAEVLVTLSIFSVFLERALSILFESRFFIKCCKGKSIKEIIAFVCGVAICWIWKFDALSLVFLTDKALIAGYILSGAIVAGGSKGSLILFRDLLKVKSLAQKEFEQNWHKKQTT